MIEKIKLKLFTPKQPPENLGRKIEFFGLRKNGLKQRLSLGFSLLLVAIMILYFLLRIVVALSRVQTYGRAILLRQLSGFPSIFYLFIVLALLSFLLSKYFNRIGVQIFKNGMIIDYFFYSRIVIWEDIIEFDSRIVHSKFGDSIISTSVKIKMRNKEGKHIIVRNEFEQMEQFLVKLRQGVLPVLYKNAYSLLAHGKTLKFNENIQVIKTGIELKNHFFTWREIAKAEISHGKLEISTTSNPYEPSYFPIEDIINLELLPHLVKNPPVKYS
jgi:hypothetical protein